MEKWAAVFLKVKLKLKNNLFKKKFHDNLGPFIRHFILKNAIIMHDCCTLFTYILTMYY